MKKYFDKETNEKLAKLKKILDEQWDNFRLEKTKEAIELLEGINKEVDEKRLTK